MLNFFYNIIIYPLKEIIEFVYELGIRIAKHPGFAIIFVSIAVTLLCLPLYAIAEKLQEEERDTQKKLKPKIDKIKAVFKGDEQYMILSTYYKQNHYHPIYALRSSISLLIQIPFFMAAYGFLSHLSGLQGVSFFFIHDLGTPDKLISIGKFNINLLPILMTIINCIAGAIYTKGFPLKEKLQLYGMAFLFLILLYKSPSGLVLYWTMNNIFSLVKNIFYKLKNPIKSFYLTCVVVLVLANIYVYIKLSAALSIKLFITLICVAICSSPFIFRLASPFFKKILTPLHQNKKAKNSVFIFSCIGLCLLAGLVIPTNTISTNTSAFCFIEDMESPMPFVKEAFFQSIGLFIFWPCCFYALFNKKIKTIFSFTFFSALICAIVNVFVFTNISLTMSNTYTFAYNMPSLKSCLINIAVLISTVAIVGVLINKFPKLSNALTIIISIGFITISVVNFSTINRDYKNESKLREQNVAVTKIEPVYHLSKTNKNVIVIMLDRAINQFVPYIFAERPELNEQFKGFTYYPNTLSSGEFTNLGAPGLWGGYEYTTYNMNQRTKDSILTKHNEALKLMPQIFADNNYNVSVSDLPYGNLSLTNDMSIFDGMENVTAFNTMSKYTDIWAKENNFIYNDQTKEKILRNTLWYSIFKFSPEILRYYIYENGNYWSPELKNKNSAKLFIDSYSVLNYMPKLTTLDSDKPSCIFMCNNTPHDFYPLQLPDYVPQNEVNNSAYSETQNNQIYQANAAAYIQLGKFFDYLKSEGIYNNCRIIIVSDHGVEHGANLPDDPFKSDSDTKRYRLNCTLLVKDFDAENDFSVDDSFMTNADTPYLATKGLIENPVNPFSKATILSDENKATGFIVSTSDKANYSHHGRNLFNIQKDEWFTVKDNLFDLANWKEGTNE